MRSAKPITEGATHEKRIGWWFSKPSVSIVEH
jgi:hypothetical protein